MLFNQCTSRNYLRRERGVGLVKEKKSFLRASQDKMWKCLNYKGLGGAHIVMNVKLRIKIERRGSSELSRIEDLEDN